MRTDLEELEGRVSASIGGGSSAVGRLLGTLLVAVSVVIAGCAGPRVVALTPEARVAARAMFDAPPDRVFRACVDSLEEMGYSVAAEQPKAGEIFTRPMLARTRSPAHGAPFVRTFVLAVTAAGDGRSLVVAEPVLSRGARGREDGAAMDRARPRTVWTLDEERAEAERLFAGVGKVLSRRLPPAERR